MDKNISYAGKQVYIGIDVHKSKYAIAVISDGINIHRSGGIPASPWELISFIGRRFHGAQVQTVYEAGFSGFELHRALEEAGIKNTVVNPASIESSSNNKVKTDQLDAKKLAEHLYMGRFKCIRIPSREEESRRSLSRTREQLVESKKRFFIQMSMKLHASGLYPRNIKRLTVKLVKEVIDSPDVSNEVRMAIASLVSVHEHIANEINKLEEELEKQAQDDKNEKLYRSVPGVGFISARILSNELGDLSQFSSDKKLSSFVGLTPSEYSSGERVRRGRISRQGSARLRCILNQVSWVAITKDAQLRSFYDRLKVRCGGKKAIVAVSRKLLCRMLHMFKFQEEYRFA